MKETETRVLFAGVCEPIGGLSNEDELVQKCPDVFREPNVWITVVRQLFYTDANISRWKWKSENLLERSCQLNCLKGLLSSFGLQHEDKEAIACWMLSEMLAEVP